MPEDNEERRPARVSQRTKEDFLLVKKSEFLGNEMRSERSGEALETTQKGTVGAVGG